jgi:hypothetical protein
MGHRTIAMRDNAAWIRSHIPVRKMASDVSVELADSDTNLNIEPPREIGIDCAVHRWMDDRAGAGGS